jgi:hypothetical protein
MTPAEFGERQREAMRKMKEFGLVSGGPAHEELGLSMEEMQSLNTQSFIAWAIVSFIGSFVTTYGGYNLKTINSYMLAVAGSVCAAIPCTSPASCCGIGMVAGIWALTVLMNRDVRSVFP